MSCESGGEHDTWYQQDPLQLPGSHLTSLEGNSDCIDVKVYSSGCTLSQMETVLEPRSGKTSLPSYRILTGAEEVTVFAGTLDNRRPLSHRHAPILI